MKNQFYCLLCLFLFNSNIFAQKQTLNSIVQKSALELIHPQLVQKLSYFTSSKPERVKINPSGDSVAFFKEIGVGVSRNSYGGISSIIAYPQIIKEKIEFLRVEPRSTVEMVIAAVKKGDKNETVNLIEYNTTNKQLWVYLFDYYFLINNPQVKLLKDLKLETNKYTKENYIVLTENNASTYVPNFKKLKVDAVLTSFPPPSIELK